VSSQTTSLLELRFNRDPPSSVGSICPRLRLPIRSSSIASKESLFSAIELCVPRKIPPATGTTNKSKFSQMGRQKGLQRIYEDLFSYGDAESSTKIRIVLLYTASFVSSNSCSCYPVTTKVKHEGTE